MWWWSAKSSNQTPSRTVCSTTIGTSAFSMPPRRNTWQSCAWKSNKDWVLRPDLNEIGPKCIGNSKWICIWTLSRSRAMSRAAKTVCSCSHSSIRMQRRIMLIIVRRCRWWPWLLHQLRRKVQRSHLVRVRSIEIETRRSRRTRRPNRVRKATSLGRSRKRCPKRVQQPLWHQSLTPHPQFRCPSTAPIAVKSITMPKRRSSKCSRRHPC